MTELQGTPVNYLFKFMIGEEKGKRDKTLIKKRRNYKSDEPLFYFINCK